MKNSDIYVDDLKGRRTFFLKNFEVVKIGRQRTDISSFEVLKNSCPVCGYWTLEARDSFDICGICFWEDDGMDDFEENLDSGPNHMTLKEGRIIFQGAKKTLMLASIDGDSFRGKLKNNFLKLDHLIGLGVADRTEIIRIQKEIIDLLFKRKICGLEKLFNQSENI